MSKNKKRTNEKADIYPEEQGNKKKTKGSKKSTTKKSTPFVWGQPGLYSKFLELCQQKFQQEGQNVFEDGGTRDAIASEINLKWPGCNSEKIRTKLRQEGVKEDLLKRTDNKLFPTGVVIIFSSLVDSFSFNVFFFPSFFALSSINFFLSCTNLLLVVDLELLNLFLLLDKEKSTDREDSGNGRSEEDEEDEEDDFVVYDDQEQGRDIIPIDSDDDDPLPKDSILRPVMNHVTGASKQPAGWKVRVPPKVFQFFSSTGYQVSATHVPGHDFIALNWSINPPSWPEFLRMANHFGNAEGVVFDNDEVKQQVFESCHKYLPFLSSITLSSIN